MYYNVYCTYVQLKAGKISSFMARYLDGQHYMDASNLVLTDDVLASAAENVRDSILPIGFLNLGCLELFY